MFFFTGEGCPLTEERAAATFSREGGTWTIGDEFFEDYDLQDVVDCASEGDVIRLNVSKAIRPRRRVEIVKRLEIRGVYGEIPAGANAPKPALTCPLGDALLSIQSAVTDTSLQF